MSPHGYATKHRMGPVVQQLFRPVAKKVCIGLLTCNRLSHTKDTVDYLLKNTDADSYRLIVVDNGSTDGTQAWFNEIRPQLPKDTEFIFNEGNRGLTRGYNQALRLAQPEELFIRMNNDYRIDKKGWLDNLLGWAAKLPKAGVLSHWWFEKQYRTVFPCPKHLRIREIPGALQVLVNWSGLLAVTPAARYNIGLFYAPEGRVWWSTTADYCYRLRSVGMEAWFVETGVLTHTGKSVYGEDSVTAENVWATHNHNASTPGERILRDTAALGTHVKYGMRYCARNIDQFGKDWWDRRYGESTIGPRAPLLPFFKWFGDTFSDKMVIDLGCGEGWLSGYTNGRYTGIDWSRKVIEGARKRFPSHAFFCDDIFAISGNYDVAVATELFEHLRDPRKLVAKMLELAPVAIVTTPIGDMGQLTPHHYASYEKDDITEMFPTAEFLPCDSRHMAFMISRTRLH